MMFVGDGGGWQGIELAQELADGGHELGVKVVYAGGVDGDADAAGLGVDAKGGLEEVVPVLGDLGVEARIGVLEDDVLHGGLESGLDRD
jgi:hypothetical protein